MKLQSSCSYPHRCNRQSLCMTWDVHRAIKAGRVVDLVTSNFQLGDGPSHFGPNDTAFLSKHRTPPTVSFPFPSQKLNYSSLRRIMLIKLCRSEKPLNPQREIVPSLPSTHPTQKWWDVSSHTSSLYKVSVFDLHSFSISAIDRADLQMVAECFYVCDTPVMAST